MLSTPFISKATKSNWKRLNSDLDKKLTLRANKSKSLKKVVATTYLNNEVANLLFARLNLLPYNVEDIIFSLCIELLQRKGILEKPHVQTTLSQFNFQKVKLNIADYSIDFQGDLLGFLYQSLLTEGERNATGQYYTNADLVKYMLDDVCLENGKTFFDPCCGSGAFLLGVNCKNPENLYGMDINPVAVLMASVNLLLKYANCEFVPNVYCADFLDDTMFSRKRITQTFDYIYTNPPWGSDKQKAYFCPQISSKEKSSMFIVKALQNLSENGTAHFLLPTSLLKIKTHSDIRSFLLNNTTIKSLDIYSDRFSGVFTDFFSIKLECKKNGFSNL